MAKRGAYIPRPAEEAHDTPQTQDPSTLRRSSRDMAREEENQNVTLEHCDEDDGEAHTEAEEFCQTQESSDGESQYEGQVRSSDEGSDMESSNIESSLSNQYRASILREFVGEGHDFGSGTTLIDVVQRLVGNAEGSPFGRQLSELEALLQNLILREDPFVMMESLNELSERLLMMNGITAERVVPSNRLAKALVDILRDSSLQDHLELHLVTCRCLFNFVEVNQDFIHDALANGAIEALVHFISEITYIDLTEQALQTLEMMSREISAHTSVIMNGGLVACLKNLDFLTLHAQRKCLIIVSNSCILVCEGNFSDVHDMIPKLIDVIEQRIDPVICENACLALYRVALCFKSKTDFLEKLFADKRLLTLVASTIRDAIGNANKDSMVSYRTGLSLLQSLALIAASSIIVSESLLELDIGDYLCSALQNYDKVMDSNDDRKTHKQTTSSDDISIDAIMAAPKEAILSILQLLGALLPVNYEAEESPVVPRNDDFERNDHNKARVASYRARDEDFEKFVSRSWPIFLKSFLASMDTEIRKLVLLCLYRIVSYTEKENSVIRRYAKEFLSIIISNVNCGKVDLLKMHPELALSSRPLSITHLFASISIISCMIKREYPVCLSLLQKEGAFQDAEVIEGAIAALYPSNLSEITDCNLLEGSSISNSISNVARQSLMSVPDLEISQIREQMPEEFLIMKMTRKVQEIREAGKLTNLKDRDTALKTPLSDCVKRVRESKSCDKLLCDELWRRLEESLSSDATLMSSFELLSLGILELMVEEFATPGKLDVFSTELGSSFISLIFENKKSSAKFIELLLDTLLRVETFDVISACEKTNSRDPAHVASLTRQFRLRIMLQTHSNEENEIIVHVQAIATFRSVESYLKQRNFTIDKINTSKSNNRAVNYRFYMNGQYIPTDTTIFGAIYASSHQSLSDHVALSEMWSKTHIVTFEECSTLESPKERSVTADVEQEAEINPATNSILNLLKFLHNLNIRLRSRGLSSHSDETFRSWKLTVKLKRQLEEVLVIASGAQPLWTLILTQEFPFLFPLESRMLFLQSTSFGYSRLIHQWQLLMEGDHTLASQTSQPLTSNRKLHLGRIFRQKVRISRTNFFQSALKVFEMFGASPGILEIEYYDEVGTGLGPTLEFYSNVSNEFKTRHLRIWRDSQHHDNHLKYVETPNGLFPRPILEKAVNSKYGEKVLRIFFHLGQFLARSLFDSRIVDIDIHPLLFRILSLIQKAGQNCWQDIHTWENLWAVDEHLCRSLQKILDLTMSQPRKGTIDPVEALELYFVLPGEPLYELCDQGRNVKVTSSNASTYVDKIINATLKDGIIRQVESLALGFSTVFPSKSLNVFYPEELREIFGASVEDWSESTLIEAIRANHGYTQSSPTILRLVKVLSSLTTSQRRLFLQFLTGSPKLPVGGFRSLKPEFTVVKRSPEDGLTSDDYLPSVMTCALYLKLPEYSLTEVMKAKIIKAITEGANSFHLS